MQPRAPQAQTQVCSLTWVLLRECPAGPETQLVHTGPVTFTLHTLPSHCTPFSPSFLLVSPLLGQSIPEDSASQGPHSPAHHHKYSRINSTAFLQRSSLSLEIHNFHLLSICWMP